MKSARVLHFKIQSFVWVLLLELSLVCDIPVGVDGLILGRGIDDIHNILLGTSNNNIIIIIKCWRLICLILRASVTAVEISWRTL
jgi:hypothetical protein